MNAKQKLHQTKLSQWAVHFQKQADSGLTIKNWCDQNNISIHTYNYWKHALKEEYVSTVLPDIVPVTSLVSPLPASKRISELFHLDNQFNELVKEEREKQRQLIVNPKVDDFFAWVKEQSCKVTAGSNTFKGLQYCIRKEKYLRVFLSDGNVLMDNNRASRPFVHLLLVERTGSTWTLFVVLSPVLFFIAWSKQQKQTTCAYMNIWSCFWLVWLNMQRIQTVIS